MNESPLIVPSQIESDAPKKVTPICCIQINGSEITFYPGVDDYVLKTALTEMMKNVG